MTQVDNKSLDVQKHVIFLIFFELFQNAILTRPITTKDESNAE